MLVKAPVDEPVDHFGGGDVHSVDASPGAAPLDQLGLVGVVMVSASALSNDEPPAWAEARCGGGKAFTEGIVVY